MKEMRNPVANTPTMPTCQGCEIPLLHTAIKQSEESRSGFHPSNHGTDNKEPIVSDPQMVTLTDATFNKSEKGAIDKTIICLYVS